MLAKTLAGATAAGVEKDDNFKNTVLLLHGDGTNGAQNNTFLDSSTNAFSITRNGNTTQGTFSPFSQTGWSNYFDGTGDYLSCADSTDWDFSGDFTVECWAYWTSTASSEANVLAQHRPASSANQSVEFYSNGTTFYFTYNTSFVSTTIAANQWYHIAMSCTSGTASCYLNGTRVDTFSMPARVTSADPFTIGARTGSGGTGATGYFTGYISNVRVVNGTGLYSGTTITVPTSSLLPVTNTKLLTCQSNRFVDENTQVAAKTITVNGNTSVQAFSPFAPTAAYSAATNGGSGYFDGSGDYLSTSTSQIIPTGSFTIEAWVYTTQAISTNKNIVAQGSSGNSNRLAINIEGSKWWFQIGDNTVNAGTPILGQWNYVAMTYNGSTIEGYVNGVSQGTVSNTNNAQNTTLVIGSDWNNAYWNGYIASVRISNTVRTVTTVPTSPFTNDANTRFLCNFTNAGIIDSTGKNNLETVGNAQIDTTTKKFGTGSLEFDGTGDYLKIPKSPNLVFGTGDFTIECWIYVSSNPAQYTNIVSNWEGSDPAWILNFSNASGNIRFNDNGNVYLTSSSALTTGQWNHVAVSRSGTSLKMFFNGTDVASATNSTSFGSASSGVFVGAYYDNTYPLTGFIDDLRITKGKARYTANFTAPTKAFADQ